jgi:hypothetical protein
MKKQLLYIIPAFLFFGMVSSLVQAQSVVPAMDVKGNYYFNVANVYFEVDPTFGARISSLKIDDNEIMFVDSTLNGGHVWGSNFWPSPQTWGWPPSVELDNDPYSGDISGDSVSLLSEVDATYNSHLQFRKTFKASLSDTSVTIRYTMINTGSTANSFSPWELSRAPSAGMAFFPYGSGNITGAFATQVQKENNVAWYKYKDTDPAAQKFFSDGSEGWFAYLNDNNVIYIRKFKDVPIDKQAPGEAEIELWFNSSDTYIEMEVQGEYKSIPAGGSVDWTDKWYVRNLPAGIITTLGSQGLIDYVRNVVSSNPVGVNELSMNDEFRVYPNPVADKLTIESRQSLTTESYITFFNLQGEEILKKKMASTTSVIDVSSLTNGIYIYEISDLNTFNYRSKIIVNR